MNSVYHTFADDVSDILGIVPPEVVFNNENLKSKTQLAALTAEAICLRTTDKVNLDIFFAIAHELRHKWQMENDKEHYFSAYKEIGKGITCNEYNMQIAEVDANAFASIVMTEFFGIKPKFEGLSENVKTAIEKRKKEIVQDMK